MLRKLAFIFLLVALFAIACGGGSADDGTVRESADEPVVVTRDAGPDGIYDTADDAVVGDSTNIDESADDSVVVIEPDAEPAPPISSNPFEDIGTNPVDADGFVIDDDSEPDAGDDIRSVSDGGLEDSDMLGALNPFSLLSGDIPGAFGQGSLDPELGAALLTAADVPGEFQEMGEFSFSSPSDFGDMDMAARVFGTSDDPDEVGAMVMSTVITLPPEAMGEVDELMGFADADVAELREVFSNLQILDADGLGDGGFGIHMELDFGLLFGAFGAPEDDSLPTGVATDMYAFAVDSQLLAVIVMWPTGEPSGVDALALAQIMAGRA